MPFKISRGLRRLVNVSIACVCLYACRFSVLCRNECLSPVTAVDVESGMSTLAAGTSHIGMWFAPLMFGGWSGSTAFAEVFFTRQGRNRPCPFCQDHLVWMAGVTSSQPELAARLRDLPFNYCDTVFQFGKNAFRRSASSSAYSDHPADGPVRELVDNEMLFTPLTSSGDCWTRCSLLRPWILF